MLVGVLNSFLCVYLIWSGWCMYARSIDQILWLTLSEEIRVMLAVGLLIRTNGRGGLIFRSRARYESEPSERYLALLR